MRFHIWKDRKGEWRWALLARNGKSVAVSGEGYRRRRDCYASISIIGNQAYEAAWNAIVEGKPKPARNRGK